MQTRTHVCTRSVLPARGGRCSRSPSPHPHPSRVAAPTLHPRLPPARSCCNRGKPGAGRRAGSRQSPGCAGRAVVGRGTPGDKDGDVEPAPGSGCCPAPFTSLMGWDGCGDQHSPEVPSPTCCSQPSGAAPSLGPLLAQQGQRGAPPSQQGPPPPAPVPGRGSVYTRLRFLAAVAEPGALITGPAALSGLGGSGLCEPPPQAGGSSRTGPGVGSQLTQSISQAAPAGLRWPGRAQAGLRAPGGQGAHPDPTDGRPAPQPRAEQPPSSITGCLWDLVPTSCIHSSPYPNWCPKPCPGVRPPAPTWLHRLEPPTGQRGPRAPRAAL